MGFKVGNPGCCHCPCVADADHVCLCSPPCFDPFPKTFHTTDPLFGALTLSYAGPVGSVFRWSTAKALTGQDAYYHAPVLPSSCASTWQCFKTTNQTIGIEYILELNCTTGWKFYLSYNTTALPAGCCNTFPNGVAPWAGIHGFADPNFESPVVVTQPSGTIPFTCDGSLLEFNLPTTAGGFGVPGGGGYYAFTPP